MTKIDRRKQRTRELLQKALIELIGERGYDTITIQDIVDRANVGRTTFYVHYASKDELFMSCHEVMANEFHVGPLHPRSREEWLSSEVSPGTKTAYRHLEEARARLKSIFQGKDGLLILRQMRDWNAQNIEADLRATFAEAETAVPLDVLANYLAGAQIAFMQWWLSKRQPHAIEGLAQSFHRLQRAAVRDAFGLTDGK